MDEGLMQPHPAFKELYLDVRALDDRVRQLKKLIAQGYVGPVPPAPTPAPDLLADDIETRPASVEEGPPGPVEAPVAPPEVRARLGACVCGALIPAGSKYCPECGMPVEPITPKSTIAPTRSCPYCKAEIPAGAEFCPHCGAHADQEVYEV
jgi:RNA polymerase subunit RPABC4/transcription elongation factor Spt4